MNLPLSRLGLGIPSWLPPRYDQTHIASAGIGVGLGASVVASGGNLVNLLTGAPGTISTPVSQSIYGTIGNSATFSGATSTVTFSGQSAAAVSAATFGAICIFQTVTTGDHSLIQIGGATVLTINTASTGGFGFYNTGYLSSGFLPVINTPYFLAVSLKGSGAVNFLLLNLLTGQVQASSTTTGSAVANTSSLRFGGNAVSQGLLGSIAAAMWAPSYMSPQQLLTWARDPWSFWYPTIPGVDIDDQIVGVASVVTFKPFWAANANFLNGNPASRVGT